METNRGSASGRTPAGISTKKFPIRGPLPLVTTSNTSVNQEESDRCVIRPFLFQAAWGFTQCLTKRYGVHFCPLRLLAAGSQIVFCLIPILFCTTIYSTVKFVQFVSAGLHGRVRKNDTRITVDLSGNCGFRANVDFWINHINLLGCRS